MSSTRREFLKKAAAGGALLGLQSLLPRGLAALQTTRPAARKLKLLILGGTGFLGPHTVRAALARGHEMTLFNRGKTNPHLFPELEKLRGDRYTDISALKGRKWDAVIDTFAYVPRVVEESATLLADAVRQYVLISSISAYKDFSKPGMDETAPVATVEPEIIEQVKHHREALQHYGAFKALCEQTAEKCMPGRVTNIRPGLISGPGDPSDRFTYWPVRVSRGGEVLAPGSGDDVIEFIDVRDLGEWIIHCIEKKIVGIYNATGPQTPMKIRELLSACKTVSKSDARFTWVDAEFLEEHGVEGWTHMPVWVHPVGEYRGFSEVSVAKAQANGLKYRPVTVTIKDTLDWFAEQPEERRSSLRAGINPEREKEVLAAWHKHKHD